MTDVPPAPPPGLCTTCRHRRPVANRRGSTFSLCRRAAWDPALERYPRLPVLACHGHERVAETPVSTLAVARDG